jgi:hypothetical protein
MGTYALRNAGGFDDRVGEPVEIGAGLCDPVAAECGSGKSIGQAVFGDLEMLVGLDAENDDKRCDLSIREVNMATPPLYILVRLWVSRGLETEFEDYERKVSRIMARYGGVIERAIRTLRASDERSDEPFEVHMLKFPSRDLYDAYRDDAERHSLSGERARIITNTDILVGMLGPTYRS